MFESLRYINHINEIVDFGVNGIYVNANDLRDYEWSYNTDYKKISSFEKEIKPKTLPVVIACADAREGIAKINNLMECTEKDILALKPGKLIIGDYYMECYVTASKKSKYYLDKGFTHAELKIVSEDSTWVKESTYHFIIGGGTEGGKNLDYPHGFPYDYSSPSTKQNLVNGGFVSNDFKMVIYGEVSNPRVVIGGHEYGLNCNIKKGDYVLIDSKEKTITLYKQNGTRENYFKYRDKEHYIFEKIPSGSNTVLWVGSFGFDVTLYEERSEPKWI